MVNEVPLSCTSIGSELRPISALNVKLSAPGITPIKSRHSLASSREPMSESRFSAGVISKRTEPEFDTPPRPPLLQVYLK